MDPSASPLTPARRTRRIVIGGLALLGVAIVAFGPGPMALRIVLMPLRRPGWDSLFGTFNGVVLLTVLALPLAALVVWALAHRRRAAGVTSPWRVSLAEVAIVYGTVPWVWMILMPGDENGGVVHLVPVRDLLTMDTTQIVGNLLVFAALGFFAPLRFPSLASVPRILALGAACSVLVETAQYVLSLDRVSSVDDVLINATGAGLAALASRPWWRDHRPGTRSASPTAAAGTSDHPA